MQPLVLLLSATLLINSQACIISIGGKQADPCACGLSTQNRDCPTNTERPPSSTAILIPSANSNNLNAVNVVNGVPDINDGFLTLTVQGVNFDTFTGNTQAVFCLGGYDVVRDQAQPCSQGCDGNFPAVSSLLIANQPTNLVRELRVPFTANPNSNDWNNRQLELESEPRRLCWNVGSDANPAAVPAAVAYTGLRIGVAWSCDPATTTETCSDYISATSVYPAITPRQRGFIATRTLCCRRATTSPLAPLEVGMCVDPRLYTCCGANAVETTQERCCNEAFENTAYLEGICPCRRVQTDGSGGLTDCPLDGAVRQDCCVPTKYVELTVAGTPTGPLFFGAGECYNPIKHRCCNTGQRYDPGADQCCAINGIQSLNVPCPCSNDNHCQGGQVIGVAPTPVYAGANFQCCAQTAPTPIESLTGTCSIYTNFPTGTGPAEIQRCAGQCMDTRFQQCCNGAVCRENYEKCCNSTCCNEHVGTCVQGTRPGARGFPSNPLYWNSRAQEGYLYEVCSTIEQINPINAFWIYALPGFLLFATLLTLAFALVFANKVNGTPLTHLEKFLLVGGILLCLLACPLFFSTAWKYGIIAAIAAIVIILVSAVRTWWLNVLGVFVIVVVLLYWVDPLSGSALGALPSGRQEPHGIPDYDTSSVFSAIGKNWQDARLTEGQMQCTRFYDYFQYDPLLRDVDRFDNPEILTFGYCSRDWIIALLFFAALILGLLLLLLLAALLALIVRFHKFKAEPIQLEIIDADEAVF